MSNRPVRVLQVLRKMNRAGIETWLMHLLRHFDRREIAIDFLVQTDQPGAYDSEIRSLGAEILNCGNPREPWRYARNFVRILRDHGPYDVVHSHNYFFAGFDLRLATFAGVGKRIAHLHPVRDIEEGRPFRALYARSMGRYIRDYSDIVLAPSQASLDAFSKYADLSGKPRFVVRNCVDTSVYGALRDKIETRWRLGLPVDRPIIVYVARFEPHKNHLFLGALADQLNRMGIHPHFAVAGSDGSSRQSFEESISGRTDFSVFIDLADVAPLLQCADLFFFPSREEGFGTVAIEAAAAGLPVVAANLPAIREACCESQRAYMFPEDDVESAARNTQAILADPSLANRLREEGREWARQFSVEAVAGQLRDLYGAGRRNRTVCEEAVAV
ncbi:MAG: glycosyltransferase family 4 protein [Bryobacteraceae bacterium]